MPNPSRTALRPVLTTLVLLAAVSAAAADSALASSATSVHRPQMCDPKGCAPPFDTASVAASPGEANQFFVTSVSGREVQIRDAGAAISAGSGCVQVTGDTVRCVSDGDVSVDAGDGNDRLDFTGTQQRNSGVGGAGDDVLVAGASGSALSGGPGHDDLTGGLGKDDLNGGDGEDRLDARAGNDSLSGDDLTPAADVIEGGSGRDSLRWDRLLPGPSGKLVAPSYPLDVDLLRPSPNGGPGENDTLRGVEDLSPGRGPVSFAGNDAANSLRGPPGTNPARDNRLTGRGGNDRLSWGRLLEGGPGNDELEYGARNHCGPGRDTVGDFPSHRVRVTLIDADCERVEETVAVGDRLRLHVRRGTLLRYRGGCTGRCRITISVRAAGSFEALDGKPPLVARASKRARADRTIKLAPRLGRRGRRLVRGGREWLKFTLSYRQVDPDSGNVFESESFATTVGPTPG